MTVTLAPKILAVENGLNSVLVERSREAHSIVLGLIAKRHVFLLGPPGTAKSLVARTAANLIEDKVDTDYFEWLFGTFTTPEDVFGPLSLSNLKQDVYVRNTAGKMPEAKIMVAEEVFKAGKGILNSFLTILNERKFHNNGVVNVPLNTLVGNSNELPTSTELEALYDRLHFRHVVKPISEPGLFIQMLKSSNTTVTPVVTWAEIEQAQIEVDSVVVPDEVYDAMATLRMALSRDGIEPTDRRWHEIIQIVKAEAYLAERTGDLEVEVDDLHVLQHLLWNRPEDISTVAKHVLQLANPLEGKLIELADSVEQLWEEFDHVVKSTEAHSAKQIEGVVPLNGRLSTAAQELKDIGRQINGKRNQSTLDAIKSRILGLNACVRDSLFNDVSS